MENYTRYLEKYSIVHTQEQIEILESDKEKKIQ